MRLQPDVGASCNTARPSAPCRLLPVIPLTRWAINIVHDVVEQKVNTAVLYRNGDGRDRQDSG